MCPKYIPSYHSHHGFPCYTCLLDLGFVEKNSSLDGTLKMKMEVMLKLNGIEKVDRDYSIKEIRISASMWCSQHDGAPSTGKWNLEG
ncbi:hypothetical protein VNO80_29719 [Phaseolus coccineus]|uniref:Uncharacterized protein n=1 Tax=Phaseolus coccineus TaxID=3886 RepID=A0AAN9LEF6_PHACN